MVLRRLTRGLWTQSRRGRGSGSQDDGLGGRNSIYKGRRQKQPTELKMPGGGDAGALQTEILCLKPERTVS